MAIVGVRQGQASDERLMARDQPVRDGQVHQAGRAVELIAGEIGPVGQQVVFPLVMDLRAPARAEAAREPEPHQEVPKWRGIKDTGVVDGRELRLPHS